MVPKKKKIKTKKQAQEEEEEALRLAFEEAKEKRRQRIARLKEIQSIEIQAKVKARHIEQEHVKRLITLSNNTAFFESIISQFLNERIRLKELDEWNRYLRCDKLPYPSIPASMNAHLSYWKQVNDIASMDNTLEWIETCIILLTDLERLIEEPLFASGRTIENWKQVRESYRTEIFNKIDQGTFYLLRKIQTRMNRLDYWTVDYKRITKSLKLRMWAWLKFPVSKLKKRPPPNIDFSEIDMTVKLPVPYDKKFIIIRVMHVIFDPLSDSSKSWQQPLSLKEGSTTEIVDFWFKKKIKLERLEWEEECKKLEKEKQVLYNEIETIDKRKFKKLETGELESVIEFKITSTKGQEEILKEHNLVNETKLDDLPKSTETTSEQISTEQQKGKLEECLDIIFETNSEKTYFDDFKKDILDYLFTEREELDKDRILLRQLVLKGDATSIKYGLKSLKIKGNLKEFLFNYFDKLPLFNTRKDKRTSDSLIDHYLSREKTVLQKLRDLMTITLAENEINLRKFVILGGIYYLDLINHVEQKYIMEDRSFLQVHFGKYEIEKDNFLYIYEPPKIVETNEDEEEKLPPDDNIDKLIHLEITLPEHILWFESPSPVLWKSDEKIWTNQHVYDIKFNEEKQKITFKVGRALPIGLSAVRYNNLPYQTWELRPGLKELNTVLFSLTASTVIIEFIIKDDQVALESLQNATGSALESILGTFHSPNDLIRIMKRAGVDVFPENDAFLYIEGNSLKDYVVEDHVYIGMAMFSLFFQFSWSRWNMLAGWNTLVYQIRQVYSIKQLANYSMVMSNLYRTTIVVCSEVSPAFSEESIPNIGFNADLYSLLKSICSNKVKNLIGSVNINLTSTVYNFIKRTRFLSYS